MALSSELISKFVKVTKDEPKNQKDTVIYGVVTQINPIYVKLIDDKNDSKTSTAYKEAIPVTSTTTVVAVGDKVECTIKNHKLSITGTTEYPAARQADTVDVSKLDAIYADIDTLNSANVNVQNTLTAHAGKIDTLETDSLEVNEMLTAHNGKITNLESSNVTINERLTANEASIKELQAIDIDTEKLNAAYAFVDDLEANHANVDYLVATVADLDTLIFGSASGDVIQTSFSNAVIAQLGDAQIKSAMIENISADKIIAGDIITNNVRVRSEDGSLIISDETLQISDGSRVRVQIGKDVANDYSINIWDQNGNLMFSKGGITDSAIKNAIIRNDMVSDNANIHASKLDIDSLFEEINDSSNTIKSTQIYLDDKKQSLDVAFKTLTTEVTEQGKNVASQGTTISAIQGQISSKVWQQDINKATDEMTTKYSTLEQELDGISATVAGNTTAINKKADSSTVSTVNNRVSSLESNLSGFKTTVSNTYATKTQLTDLEIGGRNLVQVSKILSSRNVTTTKEFELRNDWASVFINAENLANILEPATKYTISYELELIERTNIPTPFDMRAGFLIYRDGVWIDLGTYAFKEDAVIGDTTIYTKTFTTPNVWNGEQLIVYSRRWTTEGSSPYGFDAFTVRNFKIEKGDKATDWSPAPEDIDDKFGNYSTTEEMNSAIQQTADSITSSVSSTYVSNSDFDEATWNRMRKVTIDLSSDEYDQDTYYPVCGSGIPYSGYKIFQVNVQLDSYTKPTWSTHDAGFSCNLTARMKAAGWGTVAFGTMGWIDDFSYIHCDKMPAYINQLTNWSVPVLYLRGGGRYYVYTDYECAWEIVTTSYDASGQVVTPTTSPSNYSNLVNNWTDHSNLETARSEIIQLSDRITANVTETTNLGTRMSTVEQTASDLTVKLDGIEIGGRNLCRYSTNLQVNNTADGLTSSKSDDGYLQITATSGNANWVSMYLGGYYSDIENALSEGDNFVISFTMRSRDAVTPPTVYIKPDMGYYPMKGTLSSDWTTVWYAGTWKDTGAINPHFGFSNLTGTYEIKNCKIEKGTMYTDWTPAPEDLEARITNADNAAVAAAKTATNYLNFSNNGLIVGDMTASTLGKNVRISSSTVDIREGSTTLASFGADTIYLGKNSETAVINLCNGSATMRSVDDSDFKIYTDKRLVMSAYSSALLDCYRDSTHMTRIAIQSADPDASYMWGGIFFTIHQDTVQNTFDMSNNTTEFKITDGTSEAIVDLNETRLRVQANNTQINCTNGLYVGYDGNYAAKITLGYKSLQDKSIRWYWSDNALHDAFSNANGQTTYVGPGDIDETTTTMIRGQYVRLYAHDGGAVYLGYSGSTAVTSDRNMKTDIYDIDDKYLDFFDHLRPITYKYDCPEHKGHRDHVGFVAQEVEEALIASGLTTEQFAGLVIENNVTLNPNYDSSLTAEENTANESHYDKLYSLRYEEFISLLVKKVQSLQKQIDQLRADK